MAGRVRGDGAGLWCSRGCQKSQVTGQAEQGVPASGGAVLSSRTPTPRPRAPASWCDFSPSSAGKEGRAVFKPQPFSCLSSPPFRRAVRVSSKRLWQHKSWSFQVAPKAAVWPHFCPADSTGQIGLEPSHAVELVRQRSAPCRAPWDSAGGSAPAPARIRSNSRRGGLGQGLRRGTRRARPRCRAAEPPPHSTRRADGVPPAPLLWPLRTPKGLAKPRTRRCCAGTAAGHERRGMDALNRHRISDSPIICSCPGAPWGHSVSFGKHRHS